jgi:two-component system, NarL family, nitrate/nitrite response regulator NarL
MKNAPVDRVINVLLVDDHAMFREGLARMLAAEQDLEVVAESSSVPEALSLLNAQTDVVLLDVDLGPERALEFVQRAKAAAFQGRILIVTAGISGREAVQLVQAGVAGILHKNHPTKVLCGAIRKVMAGEACIEDEYLSALFQSVDRASSGMHPKFTERDRVVVQHILQGLSNREIAERLGISEAAVKASLRQLFEKLSVHTRAQLVKVALEQYNGRL